MATTFLAAGEDKRWETVLSVRILVVDDFEPFRNFLASLLGEQPELQIVYAAKDGLEAVQKASELKPDLILLDIGLPKPNGIEAARQIHSMAPKARIIFVSAICDPDVASEALATGAAGYLVKSNAGNELLIAVDAVMHDRQFISSRLAGGISPDIVH